MIKALMKKLNIQKLNVRDHALQLGVLASILVLLSAVVSWPQAKADQFDDQIRQLNQQNVENKKSVIALQIQADSYQDAINKLQDQINTLLAQIKTNEQKRDELQKQIDEAQAELDKQKKVLGENIKAMYLEGQISTLEMLASSKDLSDFVDKQQYRNSVKDKIRDTLDKVTALKQKLRAQKEETELLLKQQSDIQAQLTANQDQQSSLLNATESQKADFQQKIKDNNSKIGELRKQQAVENARYAIGSFSSNPNNGYYPYANYPFSMRLGPGCVDGDGPDRWGYCTRQCVSYAAWAVERSGRRAPMYYGNANNWPWAARNAGISVDTSPREGDVAISTSGTWGHAMYVEVVGTQNGQPAVFVSQYNAQLDGQYSEGWRYTTGLQFIHFP